ncbi:MAG: division/cell wall cluster transcriptional repressor MraZ [Deltaproteobacteria bacterium RIFCSPLOWO2_12_FULL_50_11]|nr:MAG: division/cell wall cluster transcriptional repressor MraZ [Deltaproteobacteria bacterium RIFCSPHIGHO2_02_FULL_50_15]OGQ66779.1 MAG: division/cell wall cluster transcriptional repressor MraZ [Deltaproteobacteria bacterium RIFCSPLOWO2_12_FULL_50_11]
MFRGRFEHTIDTKGRVSIPVRFREALISKDEERLIITNFDQCLWAYPVSEWRQVEEKVAALPQFKPEVKMLQRFFISAACDCPLDSHGRIMIPATLKKYAGFTKSIIFVGMTKRIEIWDHDRWSKIFGEAERELTGMGEKLADLGL